MIIFLSLVIFFRSEKNHLGVGEFPKLIIGILCLVSSSNMLKIWKYVLLIAVIIAALLTPSTDPITQLLLSGAIIFLYFLGITILIFLKY